MSTLPLKQKEGARRNPPAFHARRSLSHTAQPPSAASPRRSSRLASQGEDEAAAPATSPAPPPLWREAGVGPVLGDAGANGGKAGPGVTLSASAGGAAAPRPPPKKAAPPQLPPLPPSSALLSGPLGPALGALAMSVYIGAIFFVAGSATAAVGAALAFHPAFLAWPALLLLLAVLPLREPGPLATAFTTFSMAAAGRYFDLSVVYEDPAGPPPGGRPYVLAYAPHSALPVGLPLAFCEHSPYCPPVWGRVRTLASSAVSVCKMGRERRRGCPIYVCGGGGRDERRDDRGRERERA